MICERKKELMPNKGIKKESLILHNTVSIKKYLKEQMNTLAIVSFEFWVSQHVTDMNVYIFNVLYH